jgi:hypothetical protein
MGHADRVGNQTRWQTALAPTTTGHTYLTNYLPTELTDTIIENQMISVAPFGQIVYMLLGKDTDDDTFTFRISGWMDPQKGGAGPGFILQSGNCILGNTSGSFIPVDDGKWGAAATWFVVDTLGGTTAVSTASQVPTRNRAAAASQQRTLGIINTYGFTNLLFEIPSSSIGGAGEATEVGAIWRPLVGPGTVLH